MRRELQPHGAFMREIVDPQATSIHPPSTTAGQKKPGGAT